MKPSACAVRAMATPISAVSAVWAERAVDRPLLLGCHFGDRQGARVRGWRRRAEQQRGLEAFANVAEALQFRDHVRVFVVARLESRSRAPPLEPIDCEREILSRRGLGHGCAAGGSEVGPRGVDQQPRPDALGDGLRTDRRDAVLRRDVIRVHRAPQIIGLR